MEEKNEKLGEGEVLVGLEATGTRLRPFEQLKAFMADSGSDLRRVRGVYRIGKTCMIVRAFEVVANGGAYFKLVPEPIDKTPLEGLIEFVGSNLGKEWAQQAAELSRGRSLLGLGYMIADGLKRMGIKRLLVRVPGRTSKIDAQVNSIFSGLLGDVEVKIVFEERNDSGEVAWSKRPFPKPIVGRPDMVIRGLSEEESRELIRGVISRVIGKEEREDFQLRYVEQDILAFCGRHPHLIAMLCKWFADQVVSLPRAVPLPGDRRGLWGFLLAVAERYSLAFRSCVDEICGDLSEDARTYVESVVRKRQKEESTSEAIVSELSAAGLIIDASRLAFLVRLFHPKATGGLSDLEVEEERSKEQALSVLRGETLALWRRIWSSLWNSDTYRRLLQPVSEEGREFGAIIEAEQDRGRLEKWQEDCRNIDESGGNDLRVRKVVELLQDRKAR
ncbi:MAG: hypothetical protein WAM82_22885 [Thermoanaerobaculia bacterium]